MPTYFQVEIVTVLGYGDCYICFKEHCLDHTQVSEIHSQFLNHQLHRIAFSLKLTTELVIS